MAERFGFPVWLVRLVWFFLLLPGGLPGLILTSSAGSLSHLSQLAPGGCQMPSADIFLGLLPSIDELSVSAYVL